MADVHASLDNGTGRYEVTIVGEESYDLHPTHREGDPPAYDVYRNGGRVGEVRSDGVSVLADRIEQQTNVDTRPRDRTGSILEFPEVIAAVQKIHEGAPWRTPRTP